MGAKHAVVLREIEQVKEDNQPVHVLYSFPNKLGAQRICYTAWQQVRGLAAAGAQVLVYTGGLLRPVPAGVEVRTTLARGKLRIPYKLIGNQRAMALHDAIVARQIERLAGKIDIVHVWPQGALRTIKAARRFGIPTVLERCNAHTRYAYEVVRDECQRLGVALPPGHESAFNEKVLEREEEEFRQTDRLLCPSDFVVRTFADRGFEAQRLARHLYGFDEAAYHPSGERRIAKPGLTMLFVGVCAVRKGLHFALEAWLRSPASKDGTFLIVGEFLPAYREKLREMLAHPSVRVLGHRKDVPELMRQTDILVQPSIEEDSALVTAEARGSGCALLCSDAAGAVCTRMQNALVHRAGDVATLGRHISMLHEDRGLLERLRGASLEMAPNLTWTAAGVRLNEVYRETIAMYRGRPSVQIRSEVSVDTARSKTRSAPAIAASASVATPRTAATKYVLISPVRDEELFIADTIDSILGQTIPPAQWIIVNDGSRDRTGSILDEYARRYPSLLAVHREDRGRRVAGSGVMEAFYSGYERLQRDDWDFIGKFDGDMVLPPTYFESCFERFAQNSNLGICGGVMYCEDGGQIKIDEQPENHVRGAVKLYRRACWTDIGGLIRSTGWDTVDEIHANMLGWRTRSFPDLKVLHRRPTGAAAGAWRDSLKNGRADYVSGYHPLFLVAKCIRRIFQKPYLVKSVAHACGYLSGCFSPSQRSGNAELVRYIRRRQMRRLFLLESKGNK